MCTFFAWQGTRRGKSTISNSSSNFEGPETFYQAHLYIQLQIRHHHHQILAQLVQFWRPKFQEAQQVSIWFHHQIPCAEASSLLWIDRHHCSQTWYKPLVYRRCDTWADYHTKLALLLQTSAFRDWKEFPPSTEQDLLSKDSESLITVHRRRS